MGGILKPKVPDNSTQLAEIKRQEKEAQKRAEEEKKRSNRDLLALRQRRFGRQSLLRNKGGELGVSNTLGQVGNTQDKGGQS